MITINLRRSIWRMARFSKTCALISIKIVWFWSAHHWHVSAKNKSEIFNQLKFVDLILLSFSITSAESLNILFLYHNFKIYWSFLFKKCCFLLTVMERTHFVLFWLKHEMSISVVFQNLEYAKPVGEQLLCIRQKFNWHRLQTVFSLKNLLRKKRKYILKYNSPFRWGHNS